MTVADDSLAPENEALAAPEVPTYASFPVDERESLASVESQAAPVVLYIAGPFYITTFNSGVAGVPVIDQAGEIVPAEDVAEVIAKAAAHGIKIERR